jgi:phage/plasmid-like protein (TIGR03299 family)
MSKETMRDLQINTLIGMTEQRGNAWHRRDDLRRNEDGTYLEDNHYKGMIPVKDVLRRLFYWNPVSLPVAYLKPCEPDEADFITQAGAAVKVIESQQDRKGLLRDDTYFDLGVFKVAEHHPYQIGLIREAERLTGSILGISSAGVLSKGGKAWVEFSLPETHHDGKSGFSYRPNLLKADSMDGSMAQTTALTINATVCDNTLDWNLMEAKGAGLVFKRRHTRNFTDLQDERDALGILEQVDTEFTKGLHKLIARKVTEPKVIQVLDVIMPLPEDDGRAKTQQQNRRDQWFDLYINDERCAPWKGTAFGVVQTDNTYRHWFSQIQKSGEDKRGRAERNTWRAIKGSQAAADQKIVKALELVLA